MIKVLVVDDSSTICKILKQLLEQDKDIQVVGFAHDPFEAREKIVQLKPDIISLDIDMPRMNGIKFLRMLMQHHPLPVIIISSFTNDNPTYVMALEHGALEVINKSRLSEPGYSAGKMLQDLFKSASQVNLKYIQPKAQHKYYYDLPYTLQNMIGIGASTGGTEAIVCLLSALPASIPGIVIVQHMPEAFAIAFAERLNSITRFEVSIARGQEVVTPGHVLLATGDQHVVVKKHDGKIFTRLINGEKENYHRPSIDVLFRSIAEEVGGQSVGVLLTGMGSDGANGLLTMKQAGAYTVAQDESTSVVYGMPKAAAERGAAQEILGLHEIPRGVIEKLKQLMI